MKHNHVGRNRGQACGNKLCISKWPCIGTKLNENKTVYMTTMALMS